MIICENVCGFATFALALVNNRYVLTSFPRFEIDRFLTTGCCLVIQFRPGYGFHSFARHSVT